MIQKAISTTLGAGIIVKILSGLGVGIVSYLGVNALLNAVETQLKGYITGFPSDILSILGLAEIDFFINIMFSAYAARIAMAAMTRFRLGSSSAAGGPL